MSVDKFFLTEITLNLKNLHNLQHSQVKSKGDDDTCAPEINQQARTKPKFFTFRRWVLVISLTINIQCLNSLGKHATKSTSTEMLNHNCHIESVADRLT